MVELVRASKVLLLLHDTHEWSSRWRQRIRNNENDSPAAKGD